MSLRNATASFKGILFELLMIDHIINNRNENIQDDIIKLQDDDIIKLQDKEDISITTGNTSKIILIQLKYHETPQSESISKGTGLMKVIESIIKENTYDIAKYNIKYIVRNPKWSGGLVNSDNTTNIDKLIIASIGVLYKELKIKLKHNNISSYDKKEILSIYTDQKTSINNKNPNIQKLVEALNNPDSIWGKFFYKRFKLIEFKCRNFYYMENEQLRVVSFIIKYFDILSHDGMKISEFNIKFKLYDKKTLHDIIISISKNTEENAYNILRKINPSIVINGVTGEVLIELTKIYEKIVYIDRKDKKNLTKTYIWYLNELKNIVDKYQNFYKFQSRLYGVILKMNNNSGLGISHERYKWTLSDFYKF